MLEHCGHLRERGRVVDAVAYHGHTRALRKLQRPHLCTP